MKQFISQVKSLIEQTRRDWVKEVIVNYRLKSNSVWRPYGYRSKLEMVEDLLKK